MPKVLAMMTSEELSEYQEIVNWREAAEMSPNDLTLQQAYEIVSRDRDFGIRMRQKHELEDDETMSFDSTSGAILAVEE